MKKFLMISILIFVQGAWGDGTTGYQFQNNSNQKNPQANVNSNGLTGSNPFSSLPNALPSSSVKCTSPGGCLDPSTATFASSGADPDCQNAQKNLNTICIGNNNPGIQKAVSAIAAVGTAGLSIMDACSKFNDTLKMANDAIIVYNGACAAAGYACKSVCTAAGARHNTVDAEIKAADEAVSTACQTSMKANLIDAGIGVAGMAASSMLGKQCEQKTTDDSVACTVQTAANGSTTNPLCINGIDCSLAANSTNPTCICNSSPNSPGCPGATSYGGGATASNYGTAPNSTSGTSSTSSTTSSGLSAVTRSATLPSSADGSTSGGGSGSGGYGGAVSGDSIAASADSKKGQTADKKGSLNTNILSEYDGGGGGSRGGGSGSNNSGYNAYMPGQKKDPSRALASQNAISSQVTSAGSKSNWEKVTERYTENKSTLMGD